MKSLRRSLNNGNGNGTSPHPSPDLPYNGSSNPTLSRPSEKVAPPQKVIKALSSYRSKTPQELSYTKGDFWYVTGEREGWYEALSKSSTSGGDADGRSVDWFERIGSQGPVRRVYQGWESDIGKCTTRIFHWSSPVRILPSRDR